jgi:hypothetical protein
MWAAALDQSGWSEQEAAHLAECPACREQLGRVALLASELWIARRSEPSAEAMNRYSALFAVVQRKRARGVGDLLGALRGLLVFDSRLQSAGMRAGAADTYSLLYETEDADIELYIQPLRDARLRVEGELSPAGEGGPYGAALIQLIPSEPGRAVAEVESENGRFRFDRVAPGSYLLSITPAQGRVLEIEKLELE